MKISYSLIKGLAGGDIYFERLSKAMNKFNIETKIKYYPHILEIAPFLIKPISNKIESCDIIHSNTDCGFAVKVKSKPLVVTAHHMVFNPLYQHYTSLSQKIFHKVLFRYTKNSLNCADCIIAVSEYTKKEIERIYGITDVKVIYNGIETDIFKPMKVEDLYPNKIKLLFVGNLTKRKGADLLPTIMEKLDDRFILLYTSGLRTKKEGYLNKKMIPVGKLSLPKLVEMYNLCDILVAPSRLEGFGYSVAEAMSCGKPVVATNCSSLPELIENGKGGFLCDIDDTKSFANLIMTLGMDGNLQKEMGRYNRNKILDKFNVSKMGIEYERLYKKIL